MNTNVLKGRSLLGVLKETYRQFGEDRALRLSAALAYYATFSIAPLLVIAIGVAGWFLGEQAVSGQLQQQLQGTVGPEASRAINSMVASASKPSSSMLATILGLVTLLLGASGVFSQLKDALNTVWEVQSKPGLGVKKMVKDRLLSFGMVLVIGFLLLVSLVLSTMLSAFSQSLSQLLPLPGWFWSIAEFVVSFGLVTCLFALIFKMLPDVEVQWKNVWVGAAVTSLLFVIGKQLLSLYLGHTAASSPYGAATSVILLLLWVYYASAILLFGAEFTQVYTTAAGEEIVPSPTAEAMGAQARLQQGLAVTREAEASAPVPEIITVPVYAQPPGPSLPHHLADVPQFFKDSPAAALTAAIGCGFAVGMIARNKGEQSRSPMQEVAHGSSALALAAVPFAYGAAKRIWREARHRIDVKTLWKAGLRLRESVS